MTERRLRRRRPGAAFAALVAILLPAVVALAALPALAAPPAAVRVIPVTGTIDPVVARYLERALGDAERGGARAVVIELDTLGGRLDAALKIRDLLLASPLQVACFVKGRAWSAGALIALSCRDIVMARGASIGAAEPRPADAKTVAAVRAEFEATATATGHDPLLAAAMVDAAVVVPGVKAAGDVLALPWDRAVGLKLALSSATDRAGALAALGLGGQTVQESRMSHAESVSRVVVGPVVATVLLAVGITGLVAELFIPGFGVAGAVGLASLALYFGGHIIAGFAGLETVALFILGLVLLVVEVFVPGFGVPGVAGILSLLFAVILAAESWQQAVRSLAVAIIAAAGVVLLLARFFGARVVWKRLALSTTLSRREGFSAVPARESLAGKTGAALTTLRPAGTAEIDGARVDVVTDGEFIAPGTAVEVVRVDGGRVVVRARQQG